MGKWMTDAWLGNVVTPILTITTGPLKVPDGTAAAPSIVSSSRTTTGLFWAAGPILGVSVSGTEALRWNASQQTLPSINGTAATPAIAGINFATTGLFWATGPNLSFSLSGVEGMRLTSTGLGLGTLVAATPLVLLHLRSAAVTQRFEYTTVGAGGLLQTVAPGADNGWAVGHIDSTTLGIQFGTNAGGGSTSLTTRATLTNAGDFGVNVAIPSHRVDVSLGTITSQKAIYNAIGTWNAAGVVFSADIINITNTASAAGSLLWDRQVGGVSQGKLDKGGAMTLAGALSATSGTFTGLTANTAIVSGAGGLVQSVTAVANSVLVSGAPPTFSASPTVTSLAATGSIQTSSASTPIGYAAGAGGTVTQVTSKATGVTLNTTTGQITTTADALAANTTVSFTLTNTSIAAPDVLILNHVSGGTAGSYTLNSQAAAGSASINIRNVTGGSLSEALVIGFAVIKGRTA